MKRLFAALALLVCALASAAAEPAHATLTVKGSDTIGAELGPALAKAFMASRPGVTVRWEGLGSATAFPGLFDGSADVGAASRPVNEKELATARELGVELEEHLLGYDGIAVIVNPANPVSQLTLPQLSSLFTGKAARWSDVGGAAVPVHVVSRPSYSGTHAFFKEKVLRLGKKDGPEEYAPGTAFLETVEEVLKAVARDPGAIGYVGMGNLRPGVAVLAVAASEGAPFLKPDLATVSAGSYAVHRPLLLYTRGAPHGEVKALLDFVLGHEGRKIVTAHEFIASAADAGPEVAAPADAGPDSKQVRVLRVRFDYASAQLDDEGQRTVRLARAEAGRQRARLRLVGNADSSGNAEANRRMARVRAEAVARELVRLGVPRADLAVEVRGSDTPLATNRTAAGRRENRRVDLELVPVK